MPQTNANSSPHAPITVEVGPEHVGKRLDRFLSEIFPEMSRTRIQRKIEEGEIRVNSGLAKSGQRLRGHEIISLSLEGSQASELVPEPIPLQVVYEDEDMVVINKPAGLVVHSGAGVRSGTLVNALLHHFGSLSTEAGPQRPGIVHRLDKETSGLIVVAKNDFTHRHLSRQFLSRQVNKIYLALVHGCVGKEVGEITAPIGRDRIRRIKMTTRTTKGREAWTQYQVIERFERYTLLRVRIKTGRTHQIRVHLSSIKHPVVGDRLYGAPSRLVLPGEPGWQPAPNRNFLHAMEMEIAHPRTQKNLRLTAPLPEELNSLLGHLRRKQVIQNG